MKTHTKKKKNVVNKNSIIIIIKVKDDAIVVPVKDPAATMGWLAEETAKRYFARHAMKPVLSLTTAEGAIFSKEDLVTDMLSNNELVRK